MQACSFALNCSSFALSLQNLSPASRDLTLLPEHFTTVLSGWDDGSLAVARIEEQHGVLLQLRKESQCVHIAGLTLKDVEAAVQHVSTFASTMTKITEEIPLSVEQFHFVRAKHKEDLIRSDCSATFTNGEKPCLALNGQQDAVLHLKAFVLQKLASLVAVHVTVQYPQLLHSLLSMQWDGLCETIAQHPDVMCIRQEDPFPVSESIPLTTFDCRSYLQFPLQVAAAVQCMSFLVAGVSKEQFGAFLQQLRSTSCSFSTQQISVTPKQKAAVERRQAAGEGIPMVAIHIADSNTLHLFSSSAQDLQQAQQTVSSWLESAASTDIVTVNNHNVVHFIAKELTGAAAAVGRDFQVTAEVKKDSGPIHAILTGKPERVLSAKIELQQRWKRIEDTVFTKCLHVQHWLVPLLEQHTFKQQIVEVERVHGVACSLLKNSLQSYIEVTKASIADSSVNPAAFSWPVCGKEANSVSQAIDDIHLLLDVSLDKRELCVPGVDKESVIAALGKVARAHLVQVDIRSDNAGYRSQECAWSGLFNTSLDVTVRGIAPRPLAALQQLQTELDL